MTPRVLIAENDVAIADAAAEILTLDERFVVDVLHDVDQASVLDAIVRFRPDVVLLDGADPYGYGPSWSTAELVGRSDGHPAVVMFTAHTEDADEALAQRSTRSRRAAFAGVVPKPFGIDEILAVMETVLAHLAGAEPAVAEPRHAGALVGVAIS